MVLSDSLGDAGDLPRLRTYVWLRRARRLRKNATPRRECRD